MCSSDYFCTHYFCTLCILEYKIVCVALCLQTISQFNDWELLNLQMGGCPFWIFTRVLIWDPMIVQMHSNDVLIISSPYPPPVPLSFHWPLQLSKSSFKIMLRYLAGLQGNQREQVLKRAKEVVDQNAPSKDESEFLVSIMYSRESAAVIIVRWWDDDHTSNIPNKGL